MFEQYIGLESGEGSGRFPINYYWKTVISTLLMFLLLAVGVGALILVVSYEPEFALFLAVLSLGLIFGGIIGAGIGRGVISLMKKETKSSPIDLPGLAFAFAGMLFVSFPMTAVLLHTSNFSPTLTILISLFIGGLLGRLLWAAIRWRQESNPSFGRFSTPVFVLVASIIAGSPLGAILFSMEMTLNMSLTLGIILGVFICYLSLVFAQRRLKPRFTLMDALALEMSIGGLIYLGLPLGITLAFLIAVPGGFAFACC
jgi:hypothetical protein